MHIRQYTHLSLSTIISDETVGSSDVGNLCSIVIASAGHISSQIPQSMHVSLSISISPVTSLDLSGRFLAIVIASLGHAVSHALQYTQVSSLISAEDIKLGYSSMFLMSSSSILNSKASTGHTTLHIPQSTHLSSSHTIFGTSASVLTIAPIEPSSIASTGHVFSHMPQPMQISSL